MPVLRSPNGTIVNVADDQVDSLRASGYSDISLGEAAQTTAARESADRGALGGVNAFATGTLSGLTLGGSDYALKALLGEGQFERLRQEREDHPVSAIGGQVLGSVVPALVAPGSLLAKTPAGLSARAGQAIVGPGGAARVLAGAGVEGALQNAGAYISDTALGDRELSAEGLSGALGSGFAFGAVGGAAAHGLIKGTIAARRLFGRVAEGGEQAAQDAAAAWDRGSQEAISAGDQAADAARARLAEARNARLQADLARKQARAGELEGRAATQDAEAKRIYGEVNKDFVTKFEGAKAARAEQAALDGAALDGVATAAPPAPEAALASPVAPSALDPTRQARGVELAFMSDMEPTSDNIARLLAHDDALKAARAAGLSDSDAWAKAQAAFDGAAPPIMTPAAEEKLTAALAEHDAARADLDDLLKRIEGPEIKAGIRPPEYAVPPAEFGAPGARGYDPGNVKAPGPPSMAEGMLGAGTPPPVTVVGKKLGAGTPVETPSDDLLAALGGTKQRLDVGEGLGKVAGRDILAEQPSGLEGLVRAQREASLTEAPPRLHVAEEVDADGDAVSVLRGLPDTGHPDVAYDSYAKLRKDFTNRLSKDEKRAILDYSSDRSYGINKTLRTKAIGDGMNITTRTVEGVDSALAREHLQDAIRVYRGLDGKEAGELWGRGLKAGDRVVDRAPVSASTEFGMARRGDVTLAIDVPKGYQAAAIPTTNSLENEILLRRDSMFEVMSIGRLDDGHIVAHVKVVPKEMRPLSAYRASNQPWEIVDAGQPRTIATVRAEYDDVMARLKASKDVPERRALSSQADALSDELDALGDFTPAVPRSAAKPAESDRFVPGPNGVIPALEHPTDEAADFLIRRAREQGVKFGDRKTFLGSLGVDWSVPQHQKTAKALLTSGRLKLSRADLVGAMDPKMVAASEIVDQGPGGFGNSTFHFLEDDGRKLASIAERVPSPTSDLEAALQGTAAKINEGRTLGQIGAESPARAEYVAQKAAKREADAAFFRARHAARGDGGELERLLGATAREVEKLPPGAHLGDIAGARSHMHPLAVRELEAVHDAAVERASAAIDPVERAAAEREVAAIEEQMSRVGARPGAVEDVAAAAPIITRYEKAAAALIEELGDAAPRAAQTAAKAFRDAEGAAERKTMERATRAIDDEAGRVDRSARVDSQGRPLTVVDMSRKNSEAAMVAGSKATADRAAGDAARAAEEAAHDRLLRMEMRGPYAPRQITDKEQRAISHADMLKVNAAHARAVASEAEARLGAEIPPLPRAPAARAPSSTATVGATGQSFAGKATDAAMLAGMGVEMADMAGLSGIPHPKDIPVVGSLLSLYLKYRIFKAAAGRFVGRVGATGDARAASLAAQVKDKIAGAVDASLGLAERGARAGRPVVVASTVKALDTLRERAFDDGEPDAPKNASMTRLAAARIREVAAAATRPDLVIAQVRRELADVTDPDLLAAAEKHRVAVYQYLAGVAPKAPPPNPYTKQEWEPSPGAAMKFARQLEGAFNPVAVFDALRNGTLAPESAETLRATSPKLFGLAQQRLAARAGDLEHPVPHDQLQRNAMLFMTPLTSASDPETAAALQSVYTRSAPQQQPAPGAPPMPSIANGTNITNMYQPALDRRAAR